MVKKAIKHKGGSPSKEINNYMRTYTLPEQGVSVEARSAEEAVSKAKKEKKDK